MTLWRNVRNVLTVGFQWGAFILSCGAVDVFGCWSDQKINKQGEISGMNNALEPLWSMENWYLYWSRSVHHGPLLLRKREIREIWLQGSPQSCQKLLRPMVQKIIYDENNANLLCVTVLSGTPGSSETVLLLKNLHFKRNDVWSWSLIFSQGCEWKQFLVKKKWQEVFLWASRSMSRCSAGRIIDIDVVMFSDTCMGCWVKSEHYSIH